MSAAAPALAYNPRARGPRPGSARDGILILDSESGLIVDANPFLTEILGCTREELLGRPLQNIGFAGDSICNICYERLFQKVKQEGYARCDVLPLKTRDGRSILVEFVGNSYLVDEKTVVQFNVCGVRELP